LLERYTTNLGASLAGLKWDLEAVEKSLSTDGGSHPSIRERIGAMVGRIEATITTVRGISSDLRPGMLDDLGFGRCS